jgi:arylsulfatase A-like enzyme
MTVGVLPTGGDASRASHSGRPNVLIIMTDDQRQGLEVMNSVRKQLVERGRYYPNAFVSTPACCPSRASIMSGRYAHNHDVATNLDAGKFIHNTSIQFYLQRAGYRTGYIGKFLNGWRLNQGPPFFNEWAINAPDRMKRKLRYYEGPVNVNGAVKPLGRDYSTTFFGKKASDFIRRWNRTKDRKPWLLYIAPNAPHPPFIPEKRYENARVGGWGGNAATSEEDRSDKPQWVRDIDYSFNKGRKIRREQYRMLKSVDDMTQRVMRVLRKTDENKDTLIVFVSDNGYSWSEHGLLGKFIPYTEAVQVPMIIHWPGHIEAGTNDNRLVANIDIAPTILDAVGITPDGPPMDGRSLLDESWTRNRLLLEYKEHSYAEAPDWASTRTQNYQYIEYYNGDDIVFREYYDLTADPSQLQNLLGDDNMLNDPLLAPLELQLDEDRTCEGTEPLSGCP